MESPLHGDAEVLESQSFKRKRTSDSSYDENSDPEESIHEGTFKNFVEGPQKPTGNNSSSESENQTNTSSEKSRKRKYVFSTDGIAQKKSRKFYYINELTTKPRRPKVTKPAGTEEKKTELVPRRRHKLHFVKADSNGNLYLMHHLYHKSDLFFNDEKKYNYEFFKKLDLAFHVVDEIALEGLDGITIEAFWKRLKNVFPNNINKTMADRIWRLICNNKRINFYILKEPREKLIFFDRCKVLDIESGMFLEPFIEFKDIYPLASVNGTEIRGSCSTFNTRKENNGVRKFSIDKALKLYDQKLVFVADQTLRTKAIINEEADPNIELFDVEYCMLEKIGRSREQGEFTQGKMSLVNDSKKVYHNRKALTQHSLIVHQNFCLKSFPLQQNISGSMVHLSRFYHKRKTKQIAIMERIAQILRTKPNYQMELGEFRKIFGKSILIIRLLKAPEFRQFFKIYTYPYKKFYPNATKQEYLRKAKDREKQVKILRLLDPYANVTVLMESKDTKEVIREKEGGSPGHKLINYEYLRDVFLYILSSGRNGVTLHRIYDHFKTDFYSVRMAVRKLLFRNVITSFKIDLGRQQSLSFTAKCFVVPGCHIQTLPKIYKLTKETLERVLKGYENIDNSVEFYSEPEISKPIPVQTQFKLNFEPFCCTAFLTETVDASSEDLTIYDIVIKGRDKLLLIESNLFAHYMSEWDEFLLKRDDFSKGIQLFQTGFGKVIYDFLTTIRLNESVQVDNHVVFSINNVTPDTKVGRQFQTHRIVNIMKNYSNPHSDNYHIDAISKIYLFEAMFNEFHYPTSVVEKLRHIYERVMILDGKVRRECDDLIKPERKIEVEVPSNIGMEKFMGPNPTLEWCGREDDITIEIFASTKPQQILQLSSYTPHTNDENFTQRYVNRANLVLTNVYEKKIVQDVQTLYKEILREENKEGYDKKVCKKSIVSIISKLVEDGYIKCYKLVMTGKNMTRNQCFICVHDVDAHHGFIRSTIEQLKLKFYVTGTQKTIAIKKKSESPFSSVNVRESITELKQLTSVKSIIDLKFDRSKGKVFGYAPKFMRMRVLHELLFYVVREATESEPLSGRQVFDLCKNLKIKMTQGEIVEMPPVYRNEVSWRMFIPALPQHAHWPKGWTLACDIVLRMPLSIFVKLYNISYEVDELEEYLEHPIKRHYLIKYLPVEMRNILLYRRKYFHSIYETICNLCYIGLLQLGLRNFKEKDQLFMYLNSKANLYNTCNSKPSYHQVEDKKYKKIPFDFKTANDVEIYWSEMLRICMNTPLGKRKVLDGHLVTIEECSSKPAMAETLKARTFEEALEKDTGRIPGDRKGSAGFDSSIWSFVKRNWAWNSKIENKARSPCKIVSKRDALPEPIRYDLVAKGGPPDRKVYLKPAKRRRALTEVTKPSRKKFVRKIVAPQRKKKVREYCDAIDRSIMKKNPGIKVEWDEEEDQLVRYCRVASVFLCPEFKKQFIQYNILRDVLHRIYPKSKNKTARAIQRRIYVLLTHDEIMKIMETNIENLLNSDTISKYFEQIHNRYKMGTKISDTQLYIAFVYFMGYMCKHRKEVELLLLGYFASYDFFSTANISEFESILQNCTDSTNTIYTNPKTVEDVTKDTIKSVVHCSVSCRKNSIGWTFHLSNIYKKFHDDLIRMIVNDLKKDQFIVKVRNLDGKNLDNAWPIPIKFSHAYNVMKTASYTTDIYRETYQNFASMISGLTEEFGFIDCNEVISFWEGASFVFDVPDMGIILNPEIEDHDEVIEELAKRFRIYLDQIYEKTSGLRNKDAPESKTEDPNVERNIEEIKDEVRHLIFRVPYLLEGNLEVCFRKMLDSESTLEINNYVFLMVVDLKKFAQGGCKREDLKSFVDGIEDNIEDQANVMKNLSKVVFAIQNIHQSHDEASVINSLEDAFGLWEREIWDEVKTRSNDEINSRKTLFAKNYASGMEYCIKRAQQRDFPTLEEIKEGIMAEVRSEDRKIPHITDLIMFLNEDRFPDLDTDIETIEKMKDHFVMQYPKLQQFLIEDLEEMRKLELTKKITDGTKIEEVKKKTENVFKLPQLDRVIKYIYAHSGTKDDIKTTEDLIDFIKEKKELGASAGELKHTFMNQTVLNLIDLLQFLTEISILLRTGVTSIVYVHYEYQSEWVIETFMLTSKEREIFEIKQKQDANKNLKTVLGERILSSDPRKVQLKPWTKLDGCINNEVFHEWLCLVLSRCVDFPNIPFSGLCEQFHYIKPVDVYFLLEVLEELGCVEIYLLDSVENSLFSERCVVNERKATSLDSFEEMFVKPTNVSGLCFGSFLDKDILL